MSNKLTEAEQFSLQVLIDKNREVMENIVNPLKTKYEVIIKEIEQRLSLDSGSIGITHEINNDAEVVETAAPTQEQS